MSNIESVEYGDLPIWLRLCTAEDCVRLIQHNQSSSFFAWPLQQRTEFCMRFLNESFFESVQELLTWIGVDQFNSELALYKDPEGKTLLHWVAELMGRDLRKESFPNDDVQAAVDLLSLGADVSALRDKRTPFLELISSFRFTCCQFHSEVKLGEAINLWGTILRRCEVDLHSYASIEQQIWTCFETSSEFHLEEKRLKPRRLVFDENSDSWKLEVLSFVSIPLYESPSIPGSWMPDMPRISEICWEPYDEDEDDYTWIKTGGVEIQSDPWIVGDGGSRRMDPGYETLLNQAQDDHGVIALRVNQRKPSAMLRRRCSQPHLRHLERWCRKSGAKNPRPWLPGWHVCPYDGRLRFDCDVMVHHRPDFRACAKGFSCRESCVQETSRWNDYHFDGHEVRWNRRYWEQECRPGSEMLSFLTDDGRWISTETWKMIKVCEPRPWWGYG